MTDPKDAERLAKIRSVCATGAYFVNENECFLLRLFEERDALEKRLAACRQSSEAAWMVAIRYQQERDEARRSAEALREDGRVMDAARAAVERLKAREGEDIDTWAAKLAEDFVAAGESEYTTQPSAADVERARAALAGYVPAADLKPASRAVADLLIAARCEGIKRAEKHFREKEIPAAQRLATRLGIQRASQLLRINGRKITRTGPRAVADALMQAADDVDALAARDAATGEK